MALKLFPAKGVAQGKNVPGGWRSMCCDCESQGAQSRWKKSSMAPQSHGGQIAGPSSPRPRLGVWASVLQTNVNKGSSITLQNMLEENKVTTKPDAFTDIFGLDEVKISGTTVSLHPQITAFWQVVLRGTGTVQTSRSGYSGLGSAGFRKEPSIGGMLHNCPRKSTGKFSPTWSETRGIHPRPKEKCVRVDEHALETDARVPDLPQPLPVPGREQTPSPHGPQFSLLQITWYLRALPCLECWDAQARGSKGGAGALPPTHQVPLDRLLNFFEHQFTYLWKPYSSGDYEG